MIGRRPHSCHQIQTNCLPDSAPANQSAMVCESAGMSRAEFDNWWGEETRRRVPDPGGTIDAGVSGDARITRNSWGVPHISASNDADLFFAFGYAMAQDRLFQLDYLRRKGHGRLSEVLGEDGLQLDIVARTVGLNRIARAEWETLPDETRSLLNSFSDGVNAFMEKSRDCLPVEFALLDYASRSRGLRSTVWR